MTVKYQYDRDSYTIYSGVKKSPVLWPIPILLLGLAMFGQFFAVVGNWPEGPGYIVIPSLFLFLVSYATIGYAASRWFVNGGFFKTSFINPVSAPHPFVRRHIDEPEYQILAEKICSGSIVDDRQIEKLNALLDERKNTMTKAKREASKEDIAFLISSADEYNKILKDSANEISTAANRPIL